MTRNCYELRDDSSQRFRHAGIITRSAFTSPLLSSKMDQRMKEMRKVIHFKLLSWSNRPRFFGLVDQVDTIISSKCTSIYESHPFPDLHLHVPNSIRIKYKSKFWKTLDPSETVELTKLQSCRQKSTLTLKEKPFRKGGEKNQMQSMLSAVVSNSHQIPTKFSLQGCKDPILSSPIRHRLRLGFRGSCLMGWTIFVSSPLSNIWPRRNSGLEEVCKEGSCKTPDWNHFLLTIFVVVFFHPSQVTFEAVDKIDGNQDGYMQNAEFLKAIRMMENDMVVDETFVTNPDAFIDGFIRDINTDGTERLIEQILQPWWKWHLSCFRGNLPLKEMATNALIRKECEPNLSSRAQGEKHVPLEEFMKEKNMPRHMRHDIREYFFMKHLN